MEIVNMLKCFCQDWGEVWSERWMAYLNMELQSEIYLFLLVGVLTTLLVSWYFYHRRWHRMKQQELMLKAKNAMQADMRGLRFRKRDKIVFYGKRMLRKVKNVSGQVYSGQGRKRKAVMRFAKRILQLKLENMPPEMKTVEPPAEYLEETMEGGDRVPPDALYMLQSIRIFGHFEKPIFLKLCRHTEVLTLSPGEYLFKITDADDSVFIVQSGMINVFISNADGSHLSLKTVRKGESVTSLLSFVDVLSDNPSYYKTVTAKAVEKSVVIRLPMMAFKEVFNENPDIMIRVIQVIMIRLQRVLFTALRVYLGLNSELVQNHMRVKRSKKEPSTSHRGSQRTVEQAQHTLSIDSSLQPDVLADTAHEPLPSSAVNVNNMGSATQFNNLADGSLSTRRVSTIMCETEDNANSIDELLVHASAVDSFLKELGLEEDDKRLLDDVVEVLNMDAGITLITEGNSEDICVWFVMTGLLGVYQSTIKTTRGKASLKANTFLHFVHPGEIVGGLAVLTGEASAYTIETKQPSRIAFIRQSNIYEIMRERPKIVLDLGNGVVRRLSPLVRQCDYALDWIFLESGRAVYRQEESSDSTYIVLSGRMRSVFTQQSGKKEIVGEFGKGDLVGIVEMITETPRTTTVMAVRDSEIAKLPDGLFDAIKLRYPIVVTKLMSLLSHSFLGSMQAGSSKNPSATANPVTHKYSTVALVPVSEDVPLTAFTFELYHSLCAIGPTLRLTSDVVRNQLGMNIFEASDEYRMTSWLAQQEDRNIITLYQCDPNLSVWTQRCMRQADVIIIVGIGDRSPVVGKFEREIDRLAMRTQKELVLLYSENISAKPKNTLHWLNARPWVTKHHHVQCSRRMFTRKSQYRINDLYNRVLMSEPNMHTDLSRLARWLTGNSIGLVLGGGGARGAAHIGMMKAIQEAGIPIDMVGGVSIGALMGALWCADRNITTVTQKAREWAKKMTKWFRQLLDLTYPITSMFSGREFNKTIRETLGEVFIEDLWIPYFTLTTDITASCHRIHTTGQLWHYVRSSMSIAGVFPPCCDYKDGHLLLDGCYTNNVPADVMHSLGAAHIIAIDVGSQDDTDLTNYGDNLSGWWLLYKKWNPFTSPVKVPDLPDIQSRLAYVSCVRQLEEVKNSDYCEYIRPPIDRYKTLAFGSFDEIRDVGYVFGKNYFENMAKAGRLGRFNQWFSKQPPKKDSHHSLNEYTFIDLAQIVCKLPTTYAEPQPRFHTFLSEDEDFDGYISEPSSFNRFTKYKVKRSGTSLSLSENELDSDMEMDLPMPLSRSIRRNSRSTPNSPGSEPLPFYAAFDNIDGVAESVARKRAQTVPLSSSDSSGTVTNQQQLSTLSDDIINVKENEHIDELPVDELPLDDAETNAKT